MDTDSFIIHAKTECIYKHIAKDIETRFDTSNYEIDRPLTMEKIEKVIGLMKDEIDQINRLDWIKSKNMQLFKRQ